MAWKTTGKGKKKNSTNRSEYIFQRGMALHRIDRESYLKFAMDSGNIFLFRERNEYYL